MRSLGAANLDHCDCFKAAIRYDNGVWTLLSLYEVQQP